MRTLPTQSIPKLEMENLFWEVVVDRKRLYLQKRYSESKIRICMFCCQFPQPEGFPVVVRVIRVSIIDAKILTFAFGVFAVESFGGNGKIWKENG